MSHITLEEAKDHLGIEQENTEQDGRLQRNIDSAERWARNFLNAESLEDFIGSPYDSPASEGLPEDMKDGILLQLESVYDRDERNMKLLVERAEQMLYPYRQKLGV